MQQQHEQTALQAAACVRSQQPRFVSGRTAATGNNHAPSKLPFGASSATRGVLSSVLSTLMMVCRSPHMVCTLEDHPYPASRIRFRTSLELSLKMTVSPAANVPPC